MGIEGGELLFGKGAARRAGIGEESFPKSGYHSRRRLAPTPEA